MKKLVCALGAVAVSFAALAETAVNGAPELKVYASARGGKAGTDNDATTAVTLTWVVSDYGTGASSTGPLILELSETSDFAVKTEVEVAASASGELPVTGTYKVTGLTAGAMRYARLRATNNLSVEGTSLAFPFSSLTTKTSTDWISRGTVRYVDNQEGDDETGDGSAERPYATINRAAYHACQFDEIVIRPGKDYVLTETIAFPNIPDSTEYVQLTIRSSVEKEQVVIDGGGTMIGIDAYFGGVYYKDICVSNCVSSTEKVGAAIRLFDGGWSNAAEMWRLGTKIERCKFVNCIHRTSSGGALYGKKFLIWDTDFVDCKSAKSAGAVYSDNAGSASCYNEFRRCNFIRNVCGTDGATGASGGAVHCATSGQHHFYDCEFVSNRTDSTKSGECHAGAVNGSINLMSNCTFRCNYALAGGAGVYQRGFTGAQFLACKFYDNACGGGGDGNYNGGGALYCWSDQPPVIRDCVFVGNTSTNQAGGAMRIGRHTELSGCSFTNNWSGKNAGAVNLRATVTSCVERCSFVGNTSEQSGGAVYYGTGKESMLSFRNCLFAENAAAVNGGALALANYTVEHQAVLENCTLVGNAVAAGKKGAAIYGTYTVASLTNCLFSANLIGTSEGTYTADTRATFALDHCFTEGDPKFVDAANGDYTLSAASPCRNAGANAPWMVGATYLNPTNPKRTGRIAENIVDIGCYEYWPVPGILLMVR